MCIQFVSMSSKRQSNDYTYSGRKRILTMKHRILFQIKPTITEKWTEVHYIPLVLIVETVKE